MSRYLTAEARRTWSDIRRRYEAGENVPEVARRMAEEMLGETFVRTGRAVRPDVADRVAGDRSFDDDGGMAVL